VLWWQTRVQKNFALAVCDFAGTLSQQHTELYEARQQIHSWSAAVHKRDLQIQRALDRLDDVERRTAEVERTTTESRIIARFEARFASLEEALDAEHRRNAALERIPAANGTIHQSAVHDATAQMEEIKRQRQVYIPILRAAGIGAPDTPIVHLGCGRGEWLEVLHAEGLNAWGVDFCPANVERCTSSGLRVVNEELLSHLAGIPGGSVGAVTSFHMVEHLPFKLLIHLIDEALRVLKPGGLLVLGTPTVQPIPGELLQLIIENRGFQKIRRLELYPLEYLITGERP
jgi:2-polyprenyl-3-methyl-5-hydroxy-6-metoxy-1,4-benzoquinol methylase